MFRTSCSVVFVKNKENGVSRFVICCMHVTQVPCLDFFDDSINYRTGRIPVK